MSVAEALGRSFQQTSISINTKERLDFSCALFVPHGDPAANAPSIPIHLGSMSLYNVFGTLVVLIRLRYYLPQMFVLYSQILAWMPRNRSREEDVRAIHDMHVRGVSPKLVVFPK